MTIIKKVQMVRPIAYSECRQLDRVKWCLHRYRASHSRHQLLILERMDGQRDDREWQIRLHGEDRLGEHILKLWCNTSRRIFLRKTPDAIRAAAMLKYLS